MVKRVRERSGMVKSEGAGLVRIGGRGKWEVQRGIATEKMRAFF
jgi:hypothetical protein